MGQKGSKLRIGNTRASTSLANGEVEHEDFQMIKKSYHDYIGDIKIMKQINPEQIVFMKEMQIQESFFFRGTLDRIQKAI